MTYRELAIASCKIAGEDLIERAEELISDTEDIRDIDIHIHIPSLSDDPYCVPELEVCTNVYPKRSRIEFISKKAMDFAFEGIDFEETDGSESV